MRLKNFHARQHLVYIPPAAHCGTSKVTLHISTPDAIARGTRTHEGNGSIQAGTKSQVKNLSLACPAPVATRAAPAAAAGAPAHPNSPAPAPGVRQKHLSVPEFSRGLKVPIGAKSDGCLLEQLSEQEYSAIMNHDTLDPVQRLLHFSSAPLDLFEMTDPEPAFSGTTTPQPGAATLLQNFRKLLHENLLRYYRKTLRLLMEIHNDHSSFLVLTRRPHRVEKPRVKHETPYFRRVDFGGKRNGHCISEFIYCDDDQMEPESEPEEPISPIMPIPALKPFLYRQKDNANLLLSDYETRPLCKIMNEQLVMTGRASEMIGRLHLMINEFFL